MHIFACKTPLTSGISAQASAGYAHAVQLALMLEPGVQESEMQKAELLFLGTAPCKCGHAASTLTGWQDGVALCGLLDSSLYWQGALCNQMAKFSPPEEDFLQQITEEG